MPSFLILCLRSRGNHEPLPLMAFLLPPEEIVYYHYQLQQDKAHDAQERATITVGVTADSAVTPTVIVVAVVLL